MAIGVNVRVRRAHVPFTVLTSKILIVNEILAGWGKRKGGGGYLQKSETRRRAPCSSFTVTETVQ